MTRFRDDTQRSIYSKCADVKCIILSSVIGQIKVKVRNPMSSRVLACAHVFDYISTSLCLERLSELAPKEATNEKKKKDSRI